MKEFLFQMIARTDVDSIFKQIIGRKRLKSSSNESNLDDDPCSETPRREPCKSNMKGKKWLYNPKMNKCGKLTNKSK